MVIGVLRIVANADQLRKKADNGKMFNVSFRILIKDTMLVYSFC